jgi:periplasmic protein TonB
MESMGSSAERDYSWVIFASILGVSLAGHAATIYMLPSQQERDKYTRVEMVDFKPPEPPKEEAPPEPEPPPEPPKPKIQPKVKVEDPTPPPPVDAPPPPNSDPPPEPQAEPPPIVVGISLDSTSETGAIAVPVGNTSYGKADKVVDPNSVKAYSAPRYALPGSGDMDTEPSLMDNIAGGEVEYPEEAKAAEVEGDVVCKVYVEADGTVSKVIVIRGPGFGLNEVAAARLRKSRWKPATKAGQPVGAAIIYNFRFQLD